MKNLLRATIVLLSLNFLTACGFQVVDTGYRGLEIQFGKVTSEPLVEGLYFYNPFTTDMVVLDIRERKIEEETFAFTRDTQNVKIKYALTYFPAPDKIGELYKQFGLEWESKVVAQVVLGSLKDAVGQYVADDLVAKRESAKQAAEKEIFEALKNRNVTATRLDFVDLDFDDAYEQAVEQKVVAIQNAAKAKNETERVMEEARQKIETAKAEAEAMRIKTKALSESKGLTAYEAAIRWNGKLPSVMLGNGSIPMIDLSKIKEE